MSLNLVVNGNTYVYPQTGEENWGDEASNWAQAVTSGMLQKAGGTFTLTAEADFGALFGLKSLYYKSRAANPASAGNVRLGNTEGVYWRNAANSADVSLVVNASNQFVMTGALIPSASATYDLGASGNRWTTVYTTAVNNSGNSTLSGDVSIGGNTIIGDADTDALTVNADLHSHLIPNASATYNLGASGKRWSAIYGATIDLTGSATVAGTILAADGLVGTPSIAFAGDTDSGFWRPGADTIAVSTAGSEVLRIASGALRITGGGAASGPAYSKGDDTDTGMFFPAANTLAFATNGVQMAQIDTAAFRVGTNTDVASGSPDKVSILNTVSSAPAAVTNGLHASLNLSGDFASTQNSIVARFLGTRTITTSQSEAKSVRAISALLSLSVAAGQTYTNTGTGNDAVHALNIGYPSVSGGGSVAVTQVIGITANNNSTNYGTGKSFMTVGALTGSTNNSYLVLGQTTTPAGDWAIYSITANPSLFSGIVDCSAGLKTKVSTANTANPPTKAELDSTFGAPATVGSGFIGILNDNGGGTNEYVCWSDGTNWFYATGTKAA